MAESAMLVGSIYSSMFSPTLGYSYTSLADLTSPTYSGLTDSTTTDMMSAISSALTGAAQDQITGAANLAAQAALSRIQHAAGTATTNPNSQYSGPSAAQLLSSNPN